MATHKARLVMVGLSAGGMNLMVTLIKALPADFSLPMVCVMHLSESIGDSWVRLMNQKSKLLVKKAVDKEQIENGIVYLAPPGYHLLVEPNRSFNLTRNAQVNHAIPSIDVTFESAANSLKDQVIGFLGTGGNSDGAKGLFKIKKQGGYTMVQQPSLAEFPAMPEAALQLSEPSQIVTTAELVDQLLSFDKAFRSELACGQISPR